jgi:hypothetical protein
VLVVDQIEKADEMFRELDRLLPGKVAVWTSEHCLDRNVPPEERKLRTPAKKFHKDDLQNYPVSVVTHALFSGTGRAQAKLVVGPKGRLVPRTLTVVDERISETTIFDVALSGAQKVREIVMANPQYSEAVGPQMDALVRFMFDRSFEGPSIERPTDKEEAWSATAQLQWFAEGEASDFVKAHSRDTDIATVFGFAKALATGYAFIARNSGGEKSVRYVGYASNLMDSSGVLLLDATADIDGVTQLCTWRKHTPCPQARYDRLQVVSVVPHTKKKLSNYLIPASNRRAYAAWIVETIKAHMEPGQKGLVICKKLLFDNENIPTWPVGDDRYNHREIFTEQYGWDLEGRQLCTTHWGTGIGDNAWKEAEVVFLFDEFFIPRRTVIATTQALQEHKATEGALAEMKVLNSPTPAVETLWEGHLLRWLKQMALRGNGRNFDEHGVCGQQKLVCSADRTRLLSNFDKLFPGAKIEVITGSVDHKQPYADKLLELLSRPGLADVISTGWLSAQMGATWRNVSKNIMQIGPVQRAIANLGWTYVSRKGRGGSTFERIKPAPLALPAPEDTVASGAALEAEAA